MSINFYPDSVVKMRTHVVDKLQKPDVLYSFRGMQDITATPLNVTCWSPRSWEIRRVSLHFSNAVAKTYLGAIAIDAGVVTGKNDTIWFRPNTTGSQNIVLNQGVYTGTTLAAELKARLDANAAFVAQGATPFTVSYAASTGLFTITANGGKTFSYDNVNVTVPMNRNSRAGNLFGLTADVGPAASITSDTPVMGLGQLTGYIVGSASTDTDIVATDVVSMTVDNAFVLTANTVAATVAYEVVYKVLDV
jgi:hypothetical protein